VSSQVAAGDMLVALIRNACVGGSIKLTIVDDPCWTPTYPRPQCSHGHGLQVANLVISEAGLVDFAGLSAVVATSEVHTLWFKYLESVFPAACDVREFCRCLSGYSQFQVLVRQVLFGVARRLDLSLLEIAGKKRVATNDSHFAVKTFFVDLASASDLASKISSYVL
jgi:hypothetical protein